MEKLFEKLAQIAHDKLLHANYCAIIAAVVIIICKLCGCGLESVGYGWLAGFIFGFAKEVYDEFTYKGSEAGDWAADIIGSTAICLFALILML